MGAARGAANDQTVHHLPIPRRVGPVPPVPGRPDPIPAGSGDRRLIMITNCIIVGLDDSAASRAAHRWAAAYAHATGKDLCAVHVLDWPIGLNASAVRPGTRLYVPKQEVA